MVRFFNVYYPTRVVVLLFCEICLVIGSLVAASCFSMSRDDSIIVLNYNFGWVKIGAVTLFSTLLSYYFDLYEPQIVSTQKEIYFRVLLVLGIGCFTVFATVFFFPEAQINGAPDQTDVFALGYAILTPTLLLWRRSYAWLISRPMFRERVYVLGGGDYAFSLVETIQSRPELGMEVVNWERVDGSPQDRKQLWIERLEAATSGRTAISRIIVALEAQRGELPAEELLALRFRGIDVEDGSTLRERLSGKIQLDGLRPSSFLYTEGFRIRKSQQLTRQILSMLVAAAFLLLFAPLFPIVALLVRISSKGPIFFRQTRLGLNGAKFQLCKFRSMVVDAEAGGAKWATKNDPRVTKIGRFLRKTRLDEIPQLWNVLRGDMGFVGPRPERPEFVPGLAEALPYYNLRHMVRPGLTGWAQVRYGYGATLAEARQKLEYDLYYVKHMSLGLDLLIMFETIKIIIRARGAQ